MKQLKQNLIDLIKAYGNDNIFYALIISKTHKITFYGQYVHHISYWPREDVIAIYTGTGTPMLYILENHNLKEVQDLYSKLTANISDIIKDPSVKPIDINDQIFYVRYNKTLEEWYNKLGFDSEFWDFSLEDIADHAIEVNPTMVYWFINGRFYETDEEI